MSDPYVPLVGAVVAALLSDATLADLVEGRVYGALPTGEAPAMPYVNIASYQSLDAGTACTDESEVFLDIDVWTREGGRQRAGLIHSAVRCALHLADLDLGASHVLVEIAYRDGRVFADPDGRTTHAVLTFRALTEAP
ncbi:DUF3168 domain-containing protein [Xanthobacter flavus]|uniref:DUF3168 domain-containing protein n=1 Tax=Xanthobacter flavus TaxID=281 RepID=UPI00372B4C4D